jgi:hypothetical protein
VATSTIFQKPDLLRLLLFIRDVAKKPSKAGKSISGQTSNIRRSRSGSIRQYTRES